MHAKHGELNEEALDSGNGEVDYVRSSGQREADDHGSSRTIAGDDERRTKGGQHDYDTAVTPLATLPINIIMLME